MALVDLFPYPKQITNLGDPIPVRDRRLRATASIASPLIGTGIDAVRAAWPGARENDHAPDGAYSLRLELVAAAADHLQHAEAYTLELRPEGGELTAATERGLWSGCQTLRQLLAGADTAIPAVRIVDWPDLRYRGLYVESKWGPDLMELADWRALIDYMASLKLNSLGIGVYGCWVVQYGGKRTEFLMLPFPEYPELQTPKTLRYFSPGGNRWVTKSYLPAMVEHDLFGDIVAYARSRQVTVRPHFNSPGHNTLLPVAFPAVAARDADGKPKPFGFCLANPATYELLFALYDSVIDRYLTPHGVDWFHIGLDEVSPYPGIDEAAPTRLVDPWCQCIECRDKPHGQQLQDYAIRVAQHLKGKGINHITMWNDALDWIGSLDDEFGTKIRDAGLADHLVVQWWRYHTPVLPPRPEIGVRAWSTAMGGYWSNLTVESLTANIYDMVTHGARAGAEGADVYCIYDPANDRNYRCLAQFAWNAGSGEDLYQFKSRYARSVFGGRLDDRRAVEAFSNFDQAFDSIPWTNHVVGSLLYYWHTYPLARARDRYPRNVIAMLRQNPLRLNQALAGIASHAAAAHDLFHTAGAASASPVLAEHAVECDKLTGLWASLTAIWRAANLFDARLDDPGAATSVQTELTTARAELIRIMAELERVKQPYLLPQILRDLSMLLVYIERLATETRIASPGTAFVALPVNQENLDQYVSTADPPAPAAKLTSA